METMVRLENVSKKFGETYAVANVNLDIRAGEFLTLLGPSGCGKTTTLRMIAGFDKPSEGNIWIDGKQVEKIEPYHREVNTVFQSYSLFPHMTVLENVAFGLKMKKVPKNEMNERAKRALELVQLEKFGNRKPKNLSGGQQQRVAIARAIVNNPQVLLLDEPLGALDLKLRKQMQIELKHLQQELGMTFIYVTHDQEEALTMSDRIVIMNQGKIEQIGIPHHIYEKPSTKFVADFIGETNIFEGKTVKGRDNRTSMSLAGAKISVPSHYQVKTGEDIFTSIRPEKVKVTMEPDTPNDWIQVQLKDRIYIGAVTKLVAELSDGQEIVAHAQPDLLTEYAEGDKLYIRWNAEDMVVFPNYETDTLEV